MNTTKTWLLAVGVGAVIVVMAMVSLGRHDGGESQVSASRRAGNVPTNAQQAAETTDTAPISPPPAASGTASASAAQVQQALVGVLAEAMKPVDGQLKAITPAEIESRVRAELAKIGLQPEPAP